jgi:hypothetical protein
MDLDAPEEELNELSPFDGRQFVKVLVESSHEIKKFGRINEVVFRKRHVRLENFNLAFDLKKLGFALLDPALKEHTIPSWRSIL